VFLCKQNVFILKIKIVKYVDVHCSIKKIIINLSHRDIKSKYAKIVSGNITFANITIITFVIYYEYSHNYKAQQ